MADEEEVHVAKRQKLEETATEVFGAAEGEEGYDGEATEKDYGEEGLPEEVDGDEEGEPDEGDGEEEGEPEDGDEEDEERGEEEDGGLELEAQEAALNAINEMQEELDKVEHEAADRIMAIEREFNLKRRPIYVRRNVVIREIPNFWLNVFIQHPELSQGIHSEDSEVLSSLISIDVEDNPLIETGYTMTFEFAPNPFFENQVLTKKYIFAQDGPAPVVVQATVPDWKGDLDDSVFHEDSLFAWMIRSCEFETTRDDAIADIIKEAIWPNPYAYYVGQGGTAEHEEYGEEGQDDEEYEEEYDVEELDAEDLYEQQEEEGDEEEEGAGLEEGDGEGAGQEEGAEDEEAYDEGEDDGEGREGDEEGAEGDAEPGEGA